jgi:putative SOS response-associated peptidase YedK
MSRLYTVVSTVPEIAAHFGADASPELIVPSETVEALPGLVVFEKNGRRLMRQMDWGFPRLTREMRERGDLPGRIGLVADLTNPLWDKLVVQSQYRCLIPLTHFANPNGDPGSKTRSWFSVSDRPLLAWAGFCRNVPDYGPVYAGMTMTANAAVEPYNDRMPVLLEPQDYARWLGCSIRDVIGFQIRPPIAAARMTVLHSDDLWRSGDLPAALQPQMALL